MKKITVLDASVILKWAFNTPEENYRDSALELLHAWLNGKIEILLPKLWSFEVGNVLGLKNPKMAAEIMDIFWGYDFTEIEITPKLYREAFQLMKKYKVTFYDSVYHAVAILKKGTLVTADEVYFKKVKEHGLLAC